MTSALVRRESCPSCGSRDNVAVYSDGHKWCFTPCGYYVPADTPDIQALWNKVKEKKDVPIQLPDDFTYTIPNDPLDWIMDYGITEREIIRNRMGWSARFGGLIFPIFDIYGNLLLYQKRGFPSKTFHTEGRPELVDAILGASGTGITSLTLVEDWISCIKVSRHAPTLCLWGSSLHSSRIQRLARFYTKLAIWLDFDKRSYAAKRKIAAEPFFDSVDLILTKFDPKDYDDDEIRHALSLSRVS